MKTPTLKEMLAAIADVEHAEIENDGGEWKTVRAWAAVWKCSRCTAYRALIRSVDAGLMEEKQDKRRLRSIVQTVPVYRMKPCQPPAKHRGGLPASVAPTRRSVRRTAPNGATR